MTKYKSKKGCFLIDVETSARKRLETTVVVEAEARIKYWEHGVRERMQYLQIMVLQINSAPFTPWN